MPSTLSFLGSFFLFLLLQLCGRGKQVSDHEGNKRLRHIVESSIEQYESCNRQEKSALVRAIVQKIQTASPFGGFVRKDSTTGQWYNIGTSNAHDKVRTLFCALRFGPPTHACHSSLTHMCCFSFYPIGWSCIP